MNDKATWRYLNSIIQTQRLCCFWSLILQTSDWKIIIIAINYSNRVPNRSGKKVRSTFAFSRLFYPKRLTVHSGYTFFFYQYMCSQGIEPTTLCAANAMLYHWATGTPRSVFDVDKAAVCAGRVIIKRDVQVQLGIIQYLPHRLNSAGGRWDNLMVRPWEGGHNADVREVHTCFQTHLWKHWTCYFSSIRKTVITCVHFML